MRRPLFSLPTAAWTSILGTEGQSSKSLVRNQTSLRHLTVPGVARVCPHASCKKVIGVMFLKQDLEKSPQALVNECLDFSLRIREQSLQFTFVYQGLVQIVQ